MFTAKQARETTLGSKGRSMLDLMLLIKEEAEKGKDWIESNLTPYEIQTLPELGYKVILLRVKPDWYYRISW
jgi:hypothetical protein